MFNSLETRAPLLDQYLVEYVASLPSTIRTHDGTLKYLLKKVAADILPAENLNRRKQGFGVPIKHWLRRDLVNYSHELLESPRAQQRGIFNPQSFRSAESTCQYKAGKPQRRDLGLTLPGTLVPDLYGRTVHSY